MKTITQKNAFKLFFSLFVLCGANAFSFTKLPNDATSSGSGSRIGYVARTTNAPKTNATTYAASSKGKAMKSKNTALRSTVGPRVSL
jgi:hypothetical protein